IPGVKPLYNAVYRAIQPHGAVLADVQGSKMYIDPEEAIQHREMLLRGVVDKGQTELFKSLIKPGMVIVDIGANIGYYTCLAARMLNGTGHVYAFEPDAKNFDFLSRNIKVNEFKN